jgi:hypothetical protein
MRTALLLLFSLAHASAGLITGLAPVTGGATGLLTSLSNGPVNTDNLLNATSSVAFALNVNAVSVINHDFLASPTSGVTEYQVTVDVTNSLTIPLIGWMFQLPGITYDFDSPNFDSATSNNAGWTKTIHTGGILLFQGAPVAPGGSVQFVFNVDVPDPGPGAGFTSIPFAAVPEPSTGVLLLGAALLASGRLRRTKA